MKYFFVLILFPIFIFAQNNVTFKSNLNPHSSGDYNDIWGYVDGSGNEYALLGCESGTSIVNVTDPTNPSEIVFIPGTASIWRDIKTWGTYAYIVSDQTNDGLQIVDLSQLPVTATLVNQTTSFFSRAHNIFIDNGFAYVIGTEGGGGMHILDLSNPINPTQTTYYTGSGYIHDVYVWDDTVVVCDGSTQIYQLIDVTNKSNPQVISSSASLPGIYAHSGWMTEDKRYFIGCEEFNVRDLTVWDLQDRSSWDLVVPTWELPTGTSIIHNCFILGNFAHISYYTSGYVVLDISDPTNPQVAGQYDTYPANDGGTYNGAWGCYPYLPSGNTLISDISTGLYVLHFDGVTPVELTSFTALVNDRNVELKWMTATETNDSGFEIQKKSGSEFHTIGFVEGSGTTTEEHNYSYTDKNLVPGNYTYRLKQIDYNGNYEYSDEISATVVAPTEFVLNQNYPNPFNPSTKITFQNPRDEFVSLKIFNSLGEEVLTLAENNFIAGTHTIDFNASGLPSGMYIARLSAGNESRFIKMSLLK
jgi:choice-of-anchor B domain-containing protein